MTTTIKNIKFVPNAGKRLQTELDLLKAKNDNERSELQELEQARGAIVIDSPGNRQYVGRNGEA
jgi:hypothetical protein